MQQSRLSFASPSFRINTDQSNPQNNHFNRQNSSRKQSQIDQSKELSFKKPIKHLFFAEDQSQSDLELQRTHKKHQKVLLNTATHSSRKHPLDKHLQNHKYSPQMIELLQNCKASIQTLQQELDQKNLSIKQLQKQKTSLAVKLSDSQNQTQRIQQILNIKIKESQEKYHQQQQQINSNSPNKTLDKQLQSQLDKIHQINASVIKENQHLQNQNTWLQTQLNQIHTENYILNQKIHKMGKGVGKALSTIKKTNQSSEIINEFILVSQAKLTSKLRQHGKIMTHSKKQHKKSTQAQSFQTPTKQTLSATFPLSQTKRNVSFYEASEEKLADISRKAKRLDQLQKLEQILSKMQKLAEQDNQSSHNSSH